MRTSNISTIPSQSSFVRFSRWATLLIALFTTTISLGQSSFITETFESASKSSYASGSISLSSGTWLLNNALVGTSDADRKIGARSVRMRDTSSITLLSYLTSGASEISVLHGLYGNDGTCTWQLLYTKDSGATWLSLSAPVTTTSSSLQTTTFKVYLHGTIRIKIIKNGIGRLNIDNISITASEDSCCCLSCTSSTDTFASRDDNLAFGNPSLAFPNPTDSNNYLINRHQFSLSYNNSKGIPNWVSWHLSTAWKGTAERCDCFTQDELLPSGYYRAATAHYSGAGFDRGHLCPSDDRDASDSDNAATFEMTNIAPQSAQLNQQTWLALENYCRTLTQNGYELYIIAGSYGSGGTGSHGGITHTINSGKITVPAYFWKVVVVLPIGINDLARVNTATRVIAVTMPNRPTVSDYSWGHYRTTVDAIESTTGLNLLSLLPDSIEDMLESTIDTGATSF